MKKKKPFGIFKAILWPYAILDAVFSLLGIKETGMP